LRAVYDAMDANRDGVVSVAEFVRGDYEVPEHLFSFMDENSDGEITFDEWTAGIASFSWDDAEFEREMKRAQEALSRQSSRLYEELSLPARRSNDVRRPKLERVFEVMDEDGNGHVDVREFMLMSSHFGDHDVSRTIFSFMDANGDGKLSLAEWIAGADALGLSDDDFEREMNNVLEAREALKRARDRIDKWGRRVFDQFDTNKDGILQREELMNALKTLPRVAKAPLPELTKLMTVDDMIAEMDTAGKGEVSMGEWVANLERCAGLAAAIEANVNADGMIDGFEKASAAVYAEDAKQQQQAG